MGLLDRIRAGTYVADGDAPLATPGHRLSLTETAARAQDGERLLHVVGEFLDQAQRASAEQLTAMIAERPEPTRDMRADALVAGIAEHLAATGGIPCPAWTQEPGRFLDRFWFVSEHPGFRAISLAQSPIALKRRGILWPARSLARI